MEELWDNNNQSNSIILNDVFESFPGSNVSGYVDLLINSNLINQESHLINVEAWDIFNNQNEISYQVDFFNNTTVYNVYNFPNPFSKKTFFTFSCINTSELDVNIEIYALNGKLIKSIKENNISANNNYFYKLPSAGWDGKNELNEKIANGTYIYSLKISSQNNILHEGIYKLTKLN